MANINVEGEDFEPIEKMTAQPENASYSFSLQTVTERAALKFLSATPASVVMAIDLQQKERTIDAAKNSRGGVDMKATPWKLKRTSKNFEIEKDSDSAVRFTDGEAIYEITYDRMNNPVLNKYQVVKNGLR